MSRPTTMAEDEILLMIRVLSGPRPYCRDAWLQRMRLAAMHLETRDKILSDWRAGH